MRASEKTGALREALTRYIAYQEQADALRKTLVNACIYPAVLLAAGLLVTLFLMGYVVPRFSSIYEDVGTDLPFASRLLLQWGQLIDAHAGLVAVGNRLDEALEEGVVLGELDDARPLAALDQHLHRAVGQLQKLQHRAHGTH